MTRVAFVNMGRYQNYGTGRTNFTEPVHLLGMHHVCRRAGHASNIFQFGHPSGQKSIEKIRAFRPDVLGLSYIGEDRGGAHELLRSYEGQPRPQLLVGGTDVRYYPGHYVREYGTYYPGGGESARFIAVRGPGESVMAALAPIGFKNLLSNEAALGGMSFVVDQNAVVVLDSPPVPLDEQGFERPYKDFLPFPNGAQVKWAEGCWAKCSFCVNEPGVVRYRSPASAVREIVHLTGLGVDQFSIASPNFTAHPDKASDIIAALPKKRRRYSFASRVDTLYFAIRRRPEVWREFGRFRNRINLGVESLLPPRLVEGRIGKYPDLKRAQLHEPRLRDILAFFAGSKVEWSFFFIPFDWQMSLDELEAEIGQLDYYLRMYPNVTIPRDMLLNILHYQPGSRFADSGMKPADFLNFEKDPRALWLASLIEEKIIALQRAVAMDDVRESDIPYHRFVPMRLLQFISGCLQKTKDVPADYFDIKPVLEKVRGGGRAKDLLEEFYLQLGDRRQEFEGYFEAQFTAAFPGLIMQAKTRIGRFFQRLVGY